MSDVTENLMNINEGSDVLNFNSWRGFSLRMKMLEKAWNDFLMNFEWKTFPNLP